MKDKLFVFGYYEGYRNTKGTTSNLLVPTRSAALRRFTGAIVRDPLTGQPFPGGIIPTNRISPISTKLLTDFVPLPNSGTNRYIVSSERGRHPRSGGRPPRLQALRQAPDARPVPVEPDRGRHPEDGAAGGSLAIAKLWDVMVSDTYMFSSSAINQFRFSVNKIDAQPAVTSGLTNSAYGINVQNTNPLAVGLPSIAISGFPGLGDPQQPFVQRNNDVYQFTDDFSWLRGKHAFKFGLDVRQEHMFIAFINRPNGDYTFTSAISGNALADFLLGYPAQFRATTQQGIQDGKGWTYSGYAQDEFRYSDRLTLNIGLRYELAMPFVEKENRIVVINPDKQVDGSAAGAQGTSRIRATQASRTAATQTDKNNWRLAIAFTWDPKGKGKTSVRGAWGIFYDSLAGQGDLFQAGVLAPPFTPLVELNATAREPVSNLRQPAGNGHAGSEPFPRQPHHHRLGARVHDTFRHALQPHRAAAARRQPWA